MPSRRGFLAVALASMGAPRALTAAVRRHGLGARPWFDAALKAEQWIRRSREPAGTGMVWPADPLRPESVSMDLYNGMPGVVLFYLELFHATGEASFRREAELGARHLLEVGALDESGLYTGQAGLAFVLERMASVGQAPEFAEPARAAGRVLLERARVAGQGVEWNETTDIIGGSAGIGLTLMHLDRHLDLPGAREMAGRAGRHLLELGLAAEGGRTWLMAPSFPRNMPNFSHGTAGVSYFLAQLHRENGGDPAFLAGAEDGARYLEAIAVPRKDGVVVRHHDGDGSELFYLSWCHGPAGTARLFHVLAALDPAWRAWEDRLYRGTIAMGVPGRSPGFWNNISQCCGNAGVAQFAMDRAASTGDREAIAFAQRVATDLLDRATAENGGLKWIQAENRTEPANLVAQTGFMQGAAGVGTMLLHLDAAERGAGWSIVFPDSPY